MNSRQGIMVGVDVHTYGGNMLKHIDSALKTCDQYPEVALKVIELAVQKAGSLAQLSRLTGIRRQSLSLWARGSVIPSLENTKALVAWIKSDQIRGEVS